MSGVDLAARGLAELRERFAADRETLSDLEIETAFWLSVEGCEFCTAEQMCSGHYERFALCM